MHPSMRPVLPSQTLRYVSSQTETVMPVYVAEEPLDCVVKGTEKTLQDIEKLRTILINSRKRR